MNLRSIVLGGILFAICGHGLARVNKDMYKGSGLGGINFLYVANCIAIPLAYHSGNWPQALKFVVLTYPAALLAHFLYVLGKKLTKRSAS